MVLKSISTNPLLEMISTEDQINEICKENNINKRNIVSIIPFGSSIVITYETDSQYLYSMVNGEKNTNE